MNPLQPVRNPALGMWLMAAVAWVFASHDVLSKTLILVLPVIFVAWVRYPVHTGLATLAILRNPAPERFRTQRPWAIFKLCSQPCMAWCCLATGQGYGR